MGTLFQVALFALCFFIGCLTGNYWNKKQVKEYHQELREWALRQVCLAMYNSIIEDYQSWVSGFGCAIPIEADPAFERLGKIIDSLGKVLNSGGQLTLVRNLVATVSSDLQKLYREVPTPFDFDEDGRMYIKPETLKRIEEHLDAAEAPFKWRKAG